MKKDQISFDWVLIAKGIGILSVVVGHFYPENRPEYWVKVREILASFALPLFFLLSGLLYSYTKYTYSELIKLKIKRLLYPFISMAIMFFFIKYLLGTFFIMEHPVSIDSVLALLLNPTESYIPLLWFVHALFLLFIFYPLLRSIINNNFAILILFVLVNVFLGNNYLVIGGTLANAPYFVFGVILRENKGLKDRIISGNWTHIIISLIIFLLFYLTISTMKIDSQLYNFLVLMLGISGAISIINISLLIDIKNVKGAKVILAGIGFSSMTIYLFHTLSESAVRIVFLQTLIDFHVSFELVAFIAVAAGVIFPLLLEKMILRKNVLARKYILGIT